MTNSGDRLDRIEQIVESTAQLAEGNARAITQLAEETLALRRDLASVFTLTQENIIAIRELRAGQDENRAILNQILRRDQERGQ